MEAKGQQTWQPHLPWCWYRGRFFPDARSQPRYKNHFLSTRCLIHAQGPKLRRTRPARNADPATSVEVLLSAITPINHYTRYSTSMHMLKQGTLYVPINLSLGIGKIHMTSNLSTGCISTCLRQFLSTNWIGRKWRRCGWGTTSLGGKGLMSGFSSQDSICCEINRAWP